MKDLIIDAEQEIITEEGIEYNDLTLEEQDLLYERAVERVRENMFERGDDHDR